jgi:tRNA1(Val) A37 N6-methylase TrmN6
MKELVRTNDPVRISWLTAILSAQGIDAIVLDNHTSILEGQIGAIPRRVMVIDEDFEEARVIVSAAEQDLRAAATFDALLDGRVLLRQPQKGYRVAIDPVLLAATVPAEEGGKVLDVGTGVGAAALCYGWRSPKARVVGLEIQPQLAALAEENAHANGFEAEIKFVCGDLLRPPAVLGAGGFDHVMANPPFLPPERADPRIGADKSLSHVEGEARLADWIDFCLRMAAPRGTVTLVHRADRLDEILTHLHGRAAEMVVFPIWPRREVAPKRIIVRARVASKAPLRIDPGLVLHEDDGSYTEMAASILSDGKALLF